MERRSRRLWRSATSLGELGELMARWLEGEIDERPGYGGETDLDTGEFTSLCARLCRSGFVTVNSQSATPHPSWVSWARCRAFVDGFAGPTVTRRLRRACEGTSVRVFDYRPGYRKLFDWTEYGLPATIDRADGTVHLRTGHPMSRSELKLEWSTTPWHEQFYVSAINREARQAISRSRLVTVVDSAWDTDANVLHVLGNRFLGQRG